MGEWFNTDGEVYSGPCPDCGAVETAAEVQVHGLELEARRYRAKITRLENQIEAAATAKTDEKVWLDLFSAWRLAFPDKRPSTNSVKSARAKAVFLRLDRGATVEDVKDAIAGAMQFPFVVFGKRTENGSRTDDGSDLADVVSPDNDRNFDFLVEVGHALRNPR